MLFLARIVRLITAVVVGVILVGILLHVLGANGGNAIVSVVYDVAGWLVTPFKNVFSLKGAKANVAANWGLAAVVYAIAGAIVSRLLAAASMGTGGGWYRRRGPVTPA